MTTRCGREVTCWACTVQHERMSRYAPHTSRWTLYERAVEAIEAQTEPFTLADVYRTAGGGPGVRLAITTAIRDMRLHALVRCVRRGYPNRCLQWIVER